VTCLAYTQLLFNHCFCSLSICACVCRCLKRNHGKILPAWFLQYDEDGGIIEAQDPNPTHATLSNGIQALTKLVKVMGLDLPMLSSTLEVLAG
jgi:hypothetical protein